jgi:two-component system cell cycle response regulator
MKILIADDNAVSRRMMEALLIQWGYEVILANDGGQAWKILQSDESPRLALLDWMMPGMSGPEICTEVRKRTGHSYTYCLLITSREDKQDIVIGLEAGADDYLIKPVHPDELRARLRTGMRILDLEDQLVAAREVQQYKATHDELTGLLNRAAITEILRRELARSKRDGTPCGVLLADLDHFKAVNDSLGHGAGDSVLREAAARLTASVRDYDAVGRYGGEEFLIVLPGCDVSGLNTCAEHVLDAFRARPIETPGGSVSVTISMGATNSGDWSRATPDSLVRTADAALYIAKRAGRDRAEVVVHEKPATVKSLPVTRTVA